MTANDIYNASAALLFWTEDDKTDYLENVIPILNKVLQATFLANNVLREMRGKEPFPIFEPVTDIDEVVEYENEFLYDILPLGLAGDIGRDDVPEIATALKTEYEYKISRPIGQGIYETITEDEE